MIKIKLKPFFSGLILTGLITSSSIFLSCSKEDEITVPDDAEYGSKVIDQQVTDPDILKLADGTYRMYYGTEPEVEGNQLEIYTATSTDGIVWEANPTAVMTMATFPDVVMLPDGKIRMYFQNAQEIKSALSSDGIDFTVEPGVRISIGSNGESPAAPSVMTLEDSTFLMVYRESVDGAYSSTSLNQTTTAFKTATSADGLSFTVNKIVEDGRSAIYDGHIDGCEVFYDDNSVIRLRYWTSGGTANASSVQGQYEKTSSDHGSTWSPAVKFLYIHGGDPTYLKTGDTWHMYFTPNSDGIYVKETVVI